MISESVNLLSIKYQFLSCPLLELSVLCDMHQSEKAGRWCQAKIHFDFKLTRTRCVDYSYGNDNDDSNMKLSNIHTNHNTSMSCIHSVKWTTKTKNGYRTEDLSTSAWQKSGLYTDGTRPDQIQLYGKDNNQQEIVLIRHKSICKILDTKDLIQTNALLDVNPFCDYTISGGLSDICSNLILFVIGLILQFWTWNTEKSFIPQCLKYIESFRLKFCFQMDCI